MRMKEGETSPFSNRQSVESTFVNRRVRLEIGSSTASRAPRASGTSKTDLPTW